MWLTAANVLLRSGFTNRLWARIEAIQNQHCLTKERDDGCEQKVAE